MQQEHVIADVIEFINNELKHTTANRQDLRLGLMLAAERMLHASGNYNGFRYLTQQEVPYGAPGINYVDGQPCEDYTERFRNTDSTRRAYFI